MASLVRAVRLPELQRQLERTTEVRKAEKFIGRMSVHGATRVLKAWLGEVPNLHMLITVERSEQEERTYAPYFS